MEDNKDKDAQEYSVKYDGNKSEMQQKIDEQLQTETFRDMHLESGEKINEYGD